MSAFTALLGALRGPIGDSIGGSIGGFIGGSIGGIFPASYTQGDGYIPTIYRNAMIIVRKDSKPQI
jgi:hypothetical protein